MAQIHALSVVHPDAQLADDVVVGPFCVIGPKVKIGAGTVLRSHVCVEGRTTIGKGNVIYAGASIGCDPQDKKYAGEDTALIVGDNNVIRENCTFSIGTVQDEGLTVVGSDNLFMANAHVAHDVKVGDGTIIANNVALAGHVTIEDYVIVGGQTGVHQFVRIGAHAMVGGAACVLRDVPPYVICAGNPAEPHGLNTVGLRRHNYSNDQIRALHQAYRVLYREGLTIKEVVEKLPTLKETFPDAQAQLEHFTAFVGNSPRGLIR